MNDLRAGTSPAWMIELGFGKLSRVAEQVKLIEPELLRGARETEGACYPSGNPSSHPASNGFIS